MAVWAGIDVGLRTMVLAMVNPVGDLVFAERLTTDPGGADAMMRALRKAGGRHPERTLIGVEDPHGPLVRRLISAGFQVHTVHPVSSARYCEHTATGGAKDDRRDAWCLANMMRTEAGSHALAANNSELAMQMWVLARAQLGQIQVLHMHYGHLHGALGEYYPTALDCFPHLRNISARITLRMAPSPAAARSVSTARPRAALLEAHIPRAHRLPAEVLPRLRANGLRLSPAVESTYAVRVQHTLRSIEAERAVQAQIVAELVSLYEQHPLAPIVQSFPSLEGLLGARRLAEVGDDIGPWRSPRGMAAMAGVLPITRASGGRLMVFRRFSHCRPLGDLACMWGLQLKRNSPAAALYYDAHRRKGDGHGTASRKMLALYFELLQSCMKRGQPYDESRALVRFSRTQPSP